MFVWQYDILYKRNSSICPLSSKMGTRKPCLSKKYNILTDVRMPHSFHSGAYIVKLALGREIKVR